MERRDELEMYTTAYSPCIVSTSIVQVLNKEQGLDRRSTSLVLSKERERKNHSIFILFVYTGSSKSKI